MKFAFSLPLAIFSLFFTIRLAAEEQPAVLDLFNARVFTSAKILDADARKEIWDQQHLLAALQGLVNRDRPRLYCFVVGREGHIDRYWLEKLREKDRWLSTYQVREQKDLLKLIEQYRSFVKGAIVWDQRVPATALVASTAAGVDDLLPIRYDASPKSLYHQLIKAENGPRLEVKIRLLNEDGSPMFTGKRSGSAKCDALLWAADQYLATGKCDATQLAYFPDAWWLRGQTKTPANRTLLCNHDYFISRRGFFFDLNAWSDEAPNDDPDQPLGTDAKTLSSILKTANAAAHDRMIHVGGFTPWDQKYTDFTGGKHEGVATEWRFSEILSCFNAYLDADAPGLHAMANASVFQHFPLAESYPQPKPATTAEHQAKGYLNPSGKVAARNFVAIYVGDYDSAAWLYQKLPELWDDPERGSIPLNWAFNPALERRFPVGMAYTRQTATANDNFIAGDSGYGYLNPGYLVEPRKWSGLSSGLDAWEKLCTQGYKRWDLRITGFVIDGNAPPMNEAVKEAYARFSPGGVVAQKIPEQSLVQGTPFLRMRADLTDPRQGVERIAESFKPHPSEPHFGVFRTILWSPTKHKEMFDQLHGQRPDIEIVSMPTLFELLRRKLAEKK